MKYPNPEIGDDFGRWKVSGTAARCGRYWRVPCRCRCGVEKNVLKNTLCAGLSQSCGCLQRERASEFNRSRPRVPRREVDRLRRVWQSMMRRCFDERCHAYSQYGGRGITVCERWRVYEQFASDMGQPPEGRSIDRIDNNGNYEPGNCRWATCTQQQRNRRANRLLTHNGQTRCLAEWADIVGVNENALRGRLRKGWTVEEALTTPIKTAA